MNEVPLLDEFETWVLTQKNRIEHIMVNQGTLQSYARHRAEMERCEMVLKFVADFYKAQEK